MAAGQGFKTFTTGEVLTAADVNGYLMQGINVFASSAARSAAITSPQEGQYSFLKDTNALEYYDGAAWVGAPVGDITAVTAGKGLTGGGSSGDVTVALATTAKGDLVAGSGASTAAVLTVGANDTVLTADSTTATGLKWATASAGSSNVAGKNTALNSNFSVWQRGTTGFVGGASAAAGYCADRWQVTRGGYAAGLSASRQTTSDTTNLPFIQYCVRVQRDSGNTSTATLALSQSFESVNSIPLAGKTVTLSFYARAGANYSATSNALTFRVDTGTGTDQNLINGYTGGASSLSSTATLTTTWQRFSASATIPTGTTELGIYIAETPTGTAGANDYFEVTGVQLEIASAATAFSPNTSTYALELAACQRYFNRAVNGSVNSNYRLSGGNAISSSAAELNYSYPVTMRTSPTLSVSAAGDFFLISSSGGVAGYPTSISGGILTPTNARVDGTGAAGLTGGNATALQAANSSARLDFSAEL